jgi:hypothetical protein
MASFNKYGFKELDNPEDWPKSRKELTPDQRREWRKLADKFCSAWNQGRNKEAENIYKSLIAIGSFEEDKQ